MKKLSTKKALLFSALAMVLCVSMLVGTTFAWFTDSATTNVNKIEAGTLDVALEMWNGTEWVSAEGQTLNFIKASGAATVDLSTSITNTGSGDEEVPASDEILWEPGCTYKLPELRIKNNGKLALKYQVVISGIDGDAELNEAIEWTITYPENTDEGVSAASLTSTGSNTGTLLANEMTGSITISGHMKETAGNEYQGLSIDGVSITVLAMQYTHESDSSGNTYDTNAQFPIVDASDLFTDTDTSSGNNTVLAGSGRDITTATVDKKSITNDNVTIKDMTINGTGASGNDGTLNISGNNTTMENVDYNGQGTGGDIAITVSTGADNNGTVFKNVTVKNAFRGIQFWNLSGNSVIDSCVLDIAGYTFNVDSVEEVATLTVKNSTLKGWTSYTSGISLVSFEDCTFGKNVYEYLRSYSNTTIKNCEFNTGFKLNAGGTETITIELTNCTYNGVAITAANVKTLLLDTSNWNANATLKVNGAVVPVTPTGNS